VSYYYITVNDDNSIATMLDTFEEQPGMIAVSREEYEKSQLYAKFDVASREFSELKPQPIEEVSRMAQMEEAIGQISLEVAKITLLGGN